MFKSVWVGPSFSISASLKFILSFLNFGIVKIRSPETINDKRFPPGIFKIHSFRDVVKSVHSQFFQALFLKWLFGIVKTRPKSLELNLPAPLPFFGDFGLNVMLFTWFHSESLKLKCPVKKKGKRVIFGFDFNFAIEFTKVAWVTMSNVALKKTKQLCTNENPRKQQKLVKTARNIAKMDTFVYILENLQKPGKPKNDFKAKSRVSLAFSNFSNSLIKVTISRSFFFKFRLKSVFHSF